MTTRHAVELAAQRRQTELLISSYGQELIWIRPGAGQSDDAGGWVPGQDVVLPAVTYYFEPVVAEGKHVVRQQGEVSIYEYIIIGLHTADIREGDYFEQDNTRYVVDHVYPDQEYQTKGRVLAYGNSS